MLTEKQIKARFHKPHLRKLLKQMLQKDYYPYVNGKEVEKPIKWYELRPGKTIDYIVERIRYKGIEKKKEDSQFAFMWGECMERSYSGADFWCKIGSFRLREVPGTTPQAYEVLDYHSSEKSDEEKIDSWIEGHLLDRDMWVKNNTAIDIPISWIFRK